MQLTSKQLDVGSSVEMTAPDWAAVGRLVRQATLDAVSAHFLALTAEEGERPETDAVVGRRDGS